MRLVVPFFKQTTLFNCGPAALKMVLSYFGKKVDIKELENKSKVKEGKAFFTIQIALASVLLGFKTEFYSKNISLNEENLELDFYKKYTGETSESLDIINFEAKKEGVKIEERSFSINEFLNFLTEKSIPIVLLDWNVVANREKRGYQGHFVPVIGYDKKNVYVHNQGFNNPQKFVKIPKEVFDKARKARGTDEDFLVIYKN